MPCQAALEVSASPDLHVHAAPAHVRASAEATAGRRACSLAAQQLSGPALAQICRMSELRTLCWPVCSVTTHFLSFSKRLRLTLSASSYEPEAAVVCPAVPVEALLAGLGCRAVGEPHKRIALALAVASLLVDLDLLHVAVLAAGSLELRVCGPPLQLADVHGARPVCRSAL